MSYLRGTISSLCQVMDYLGKACTALRQALAACSNFAASSHDDLYRALAFPVLGLVFSSPAQEEMV